MEASECFLTVDLPMRFASPSNANYYRSWISILQLVKRVDSCRADGGRHANATPPSRRGTGLVWIVLICFGWLVLGENVTWGQSGTRAGSGAVKPGSKATTDPGLKPQPGKGKPVSTKGDRPAKDPETESKATPVKESDKNKDASRWREGHRIENVTVSFQISETERFLVALNSERGLTALENLALERIADAMRVDSADNRWVVTGRITEFRGQNYLWIERATRAAKIAGQ